MLPPLPLYTSLEALAVVAGACALMMWLLLRSAWRDRRVKLAYALVVLLLLIAHAAWSVGLWHFPTSYWGAAIASAGVLLFGVVTASLPLAALVRATLTRLLVTERTATAPGANAVTRRAIVKGATLLVPAAALASGLDGFAVARAPAISPRVLLPFPHLHPDLEGFKILQLSDLHLGMAKHLPDLERLLARFDDARSRPDLVVFTGDVAEDLNLLPDALGLAHSLGARFGVLACLGNHEYLRDIRVSRPMYEGSRVPLLVDRGVDLRVGAARLWVGGTDDPIVTHADIRPFMRGAIEGAMRDAPGDAFRLLLAHRPEAFDVSSRHGIDLTLSGHTHGGQIGFNGKSAFEPLWPDGYLWGEYRRGKSQLYTTAGFGHWFPFRFGCPAEAPLIVLTRGVAEATSRTA